MEQATSRPPRSLWIRAGTILFVLAALGLLVLWNAEDFAGIRELVLRGVAVGSFLVLWGIGSVCLLVGAVLRLRRRQRPALPLLPVVLGLASAFLLVWIVYLQVTPERLIASARRGDLSGVERCLRRGIDVDARCVVLLGFGGRQESPTALGAAAASGRAEVVRLLLDAGADSAARDTHGNTPAMAAETSGFHELARLLRAHEARSGSPSDPPPPGG